MLGAAAVLGLLAVMLVVNRKAPDSALRPMINFAQTVVTHDHDGPNARWHFLQT